MTEISRLQFFYLTRSKKGMSMLVCSLEEIHNPSIVACLPIFSLSLCL